MSSFSGRLGMGLVNGYIIKVLITTLFPLDHSPAISHFDYKKAGHPWPVKVSFIIAIVSYSCYFTGFF